MRYKKFDSDEFDIDDALVAKRSCVMMKVAA
jgi:hypothetical protein